MLTNNQKIILCATNHSLTAGLWHGTKLQSYQVFKNQDESHTTFSQYMAKHEGVNVYLIVDAVEEDYKLEALPHTTGNARRELVARKLSQFNRNSVYRTAHFINRDKDKRKDDNFIFVALSNTDFMQSWLDVIQAEHVPLVGVYLLPMVSQVMIRQMKLMAPHILLCERLSSGLRQTYLHNGRLRMSRLTPMTDVKVEQLSYFYLVEIEKTRLYLLSQRLITAETALQMVLPAYDETSDKIASSISQDQGIECKTVDIMAYANNSHIKPATVKKHPELLHMQLLANGHVPDNLAPPELTKTHNIKNIGRGIFIAAALIASIGLLLAAVYLFQAYQLSAKADEVATKTARQLQQYELVAQNFPETPIPGSDLKRVVDIAKTINSQTPAAMMQVLSSALQSEPDIAVSRIRWVQTNRVDIQDENNVEQSAANNAQANNTAQSGLLQVGFINAEIRKFTGDYRAALATASRFAAHLRADPAVMQVQILQEPVNVSSLASLQGSTEDESKAQRTPAIFKLKVVLKPKGSEVAS